MKNLLNSIALFITSLFLLTHCSPFQSTDHVDIADSYRQNIANITQADQLEGPDKATLRDIIMTMNPKTGKIPQHKSSVIKNMNGARMASSDFQWKQINTEIAGRVRVMLIDPEDDQKLWAGATTGGLWYNPDFRNEGEWVPVSDDWENLSIGSMAFDPQDTKVFYVGTGESFTSVNIYRESTSAGVGIYQSTDGGHSWTLLSSTSGFNPDYALE